MPHGRTVVATVATSALVLGLLATTGAPAFADGSATTTPTVADSQSSATSADASEIAQAHDHGVTVSDETTPTSLLTANPDVLGHPTIAAISARERATPPQVVFRFARAVGMLPLTGTSDRLHMQQDLASRSLTLSADEVRAIESLAG